jgi:peptide/nickel transport system substrate-binding protein
MTGITRRAGLLATAAFWGMVGVAAQAATPDDTLVIADAIDDMTSVDPAESFEFSGSDLINNLYEQLFDFDPQNLDAGFQPGVIESYELGEDGLTYSFKVREGLVFHSGNPLTAADVVFSLTRVVKLNKTPSFILTQFGFTAENVDELIKQTGEHELTFTVDQPYAPTFVLNCLTATVGSVVDKEEVMAHAEGDDQGHTWLRTNEAGSGAYRLVNWQPSQSYALERAESHRRGQAQLDRVIVRHIPEAASQQLLLERGDVDIARKLTPENIEAVRQQENLKVETDLKGRIYYFSLNQKHEILSKPEVVEAMKWLVDYDGIVGSILKGQFVKHQTFEPQTFLGVLDKNPYSLDVERAKQLLAEAGYPDGFQITMDARNTSPTIDMATAIQASFAQAGIQLEILPGDGRQTLTKYRARNHDLYIGAWGPDYPDPHTNAATFTHNPDNADDAGFSGKLAWRNAWDIPDLTEMTEKAVLEKDIERRAEMYKELQQEMLDRGPFVLMFQEILQSAMRQEVEGFYTGGPVTAAFYWTVTK